MQFKNWAEYKPYIDGLLAQGSRQRYTPPPPAPVAPASQNMLDQAAGMPEQWQGGANGPDGAAAEQAAASSYGGPVTGGGFPNASTVASALDLNPTGVRAGMTALGLLSGPLGMGLSAANMLGNVANTTQNYGMLSGLGVSPGALSTIGGLLGFNGLSGNHTSALNAAMANQYSGFSNLSQEQTPGDMTGLGGWGDIAAGMDAANAASGSGMAESNPSGGMGDRGDIASADLGSWQKGGYTGAGKDGVVQPHRKAGTVHEGELVIPHHVLRGLLAR